MLGMAQFVPTEQTVSVVFPCGFGCHTKRADRTFSVSSCLQSVFSARILLRFAAACNLPKTNYFVLRNNGHSIKDIDRCAAMSRHIPQPVAGLQRAVLRNDRGMLLAEEQFCIGKLREIGWILIHGHGFDPAFLSAQLAGGGLMLGAFFMATDYVTRPITIKGQYVFGIFLGLMTGIFRFFGPGAEGVSYAIILGNLLVPLIEKVTKPVAFGKGGRKS